MERREKPVSSTGGYSSKRHLISPISIKLSNFLLILSGFNEDNLVSNIEFHIDKNLIAPRFKNFFTLLKHEKNSFKNYDKNHHITTLVITLQLIQKIKNQIVPYPLRGSENEGGGVLFGKMKVYEIILIIS